MSESRAKEIVDNTGKFWSQFVNEDYARMGDHSFNFLGKSTVMYLFLMAKNNNIAALMEMEDIAAQKTLEDLRKQKDVDPNTLALAEMLMKKCKD